MGQRPLVCRLFSKVLSFFPRTYVEKFDAVSSVFASQDAKELSSLKSDLDACDVGLYAVVHETFDVPGYQPYFAGEIYYDAEV